MSFETIQEFYELGMWSVGDLEQLVKSGALTAAQFTQITGQAYPEPMPVKPVVKAPVESTATATPTTKEPVTTESPKEPVTPVAPVKSLLD